MKKLFNMGFTILYLTISMNSYADEVPEGFENLFVAKTANVKLTINDENYITVKGAISNNDFQLTNNVSELKKFLNDEYINSEASDVIINSLSKGVSSSPYCQGRRNSCEIDGEGIEDIQYVVMNDELKIRILIPIKFISNVVVENRYINKEMNQKNAVIMSHNFDFSADKNNGFGVDYENEFDVGLLGGYLTGDVVVNSESEDSINSDEFTYNYLNDNHRYRIGYRNGYSVDSWNATEFLNTGENIEVISVDFGNTAELEFKNDKNVKRLYFSVPGSGRMTVTREDGRKLLTRNVSSGNNYIHYSDLPSGVYNIIITVKSGSQVTYNEVFSIYNKSSRFNLNPGEVDFQISLGQFVDGADEELTKFDDEIYVDGKLSTQINEQVKIGVESVTTSSDYLVKTAATYDDENISASIVYGKYGDDSNILQTTLSTFDVNINAESFKSGKDTSLAAYFNGKRDYTRWSIRYNRPMFGGNFYTSYTQNSAHMTVPEDSFTSDNTEYEFSNLTAGYSFQSYFNSYVDVSVAKITTDSAFESSTDETKLNVSINIPFGIRAYTNSTAQLSTKNDSYFRTALGNNYIINEELSVSTEAGVRHGSQDTTADLSATAMYRDEKIVGSSYGYFNAGGDFNLSGDLSLTTIYSEDNIYTTSRAAESYLITHNDGLGASKVENNGKDFASTVKLKNNGEDQLNVTLDHNSVVTPLERYREYEAFLNEEASDYHNLGVSNISGASLPGTVIDLGVNLRKIRSYISVFSDVNGNPIDNVSCKGDGCLSVEELSPGVFKFRISEGTSFELFANNERCVIPNPRDFEEYNLGYNFCMPQFKLIDGLQVVKSADGSYLYYVGEFNDEKLIAQYEAVLNENLVTFVKKQVGGRIYLFATSDFELAKSVKGNIEELSSYALEELNNDPYVSR